MLRKQIALRQLMTEVKSEINSLRELGVSSLQSIVVTLMGSQLLSGPQNSKPVVFTE